MPKKLKPDKNKFEPRSFTYGHVSEPSTSSDSFIEQGGFRCADGRPVTRHCCRPTAPWLAPAAASDDRGAADDHCGVWGEAPPLEGRVPIYDPYASCYDNVWNAPTSLATLSILLLLVASTVTMFKVIKSYSKKAERKHESSGGQRSSSSYQQQIGGAGGAGGGGGSSHYEERYQSSGRGGEGNGYIGNGYPPGGPMMPNGNGYMRDGNQMMAYDNRHLSSVQHQHGAQQQGFSESSSYETREHFERKVQRVKKTRGERERSRSQRRDGEVSEILQGSDASSARDALLQWAKKTTAGYPRVNVQNFSNSWRDGLAFNAILHRYRPNLIDWNKISDEKVSNIERLDNAFAAAEREFGVTRLLDAEDVDKNPEEKSIMTYVASLYEALPHLPELSKLLPIQDQYIEEAQEWLEWVKRATNLVDDRLFTHSAYELIQELERFREDDLPPKLEEKNRNATVFDYLERALHGTEHYRIPSELTTPALHRAWNELLNSIDRRFSVLHETSINQENINDLLSRLSRGIGITNEKLDLILHRIEDCEARVDTARPGEIERLVNEIVDDLNVLERPIDGFFEDVNELKAQNHPEANDFYKQVYGLHQRRTAYLDRLTNQLLVRLGVRTETLRKENASRLESIRTSSFSRVEECIEWVRVRMEKLTNMEFLEDLETLEEVFEQHKLDNRDIQDFRQNVDQCIANQAQVSAEDSIEYCELLKILESEYQQLRDLSAGRMLDLDSLIAFVRAAQMELVWVSEREEIEVTRNWSDIKQLDLPMLTNYYKQLLHEMELREKQYNDVHNQGAALLNQGHPAIHVIEVYLRTMQNQWDWLLSLSKCLEEHLRDALNLKQFMEEAAEAENWMEEQTQRLENNYNRTDFSLEEGERFLRELDEIKEILNKYHGVLMALTERCATISPLWQRGERITRPITVTALCDYNDKNIHIRAGDDVTLLDNTDLIKWQIRDLSGTEGTVPSVVFRIPPPDPKLTAFLNRLLQQFEKLKKLWDKKHRMVRFNMVLNTMKTIQGWDLDTFNSIDPDQRDAIMRALNDDANKLLSELDPNDPLALKLREELKRTNEHFWNLLNASQRPPEPDYSSQFDEKMRELLRKLEDASRTLKDNVGKPISRSPEDLERVIMAHKQFEDALQGLDADVANVKELFRQLPNPTPTQRSNNDHLNALWEDLWEESRMYVERIKVLENVLNGILEVQDIVKKHEITLNSFDDLPAALDKLRGEHAQLLELNMVLQQQQSVIDSLNKNVALLRQHVARTRVNQGSHPDVDQLEDQVQQLNVRWENVQQQVTDRHKATERAVQTQIVYRSGYESEIAWLDRVEATINSLRKPETLKPEEYQNQLDMLIAEYAQLQERTEAIEAVNREGGKFIREAKGYDSRMGLYSDAIVGIHGPGVRNDFRRQRTQPKNGAQIVTEELELLNRRFAQLSTLIMERRNDMQVLIQNWKRQKQDEEDRRRAEEEAKRRAFEAARLKALEDADRLRREREEAERRRAAEDAERQRRMREQAERDRLAAEEAERRRREQADRDRLADEDAERRRREEEDRLRRQREQDEADRLRRLREQAERDRLAAEDADRRRREEEDRLRKQREDEERRRREEEAARKKVPELNIRKIDPQYEITQTGYGDEWEEGMPLEERVPITEHEDEMQMFQEETVTKTQFYEMEGNLNKKTGEILTFVESMRQGLLNLQADGGQFFDVVSGSHISLEKAAELGYLERGFEETLNRKWGIRHPETKEELTLLEAMQIGLYDSDKRQLCDIHTGRVMTDYLSVVSMRDLHAMIKARILKNAPMTLETALEQGILNPETGEFTGKHTNETIDLKDALYHGYVQIISSEANSAIGITLSDAIEQELINSNNGEFNDRNTQDQFTLREACSKQNALLNMSVPEVINTSDNSRLTLALALVRNAVSIRDGKFTDLQSRRSISLREAFKEHLIHKPQTLTEMASKDLIDSTGLFVDRGTKQRHTVLQAIAAGLLDAEVRHIVDPVEKDVISIAEALERGILGADGKIILEKQQKTYTITEAIHEGLLTKRVRHSIFDVRDIVNTITGKSMSFNEAVLAGAIIPNAERVVDLQRQESYLISDERAGNLIGPVLMDLLNKPIGIKSESGDFDLSLVRAVSKGVVDPTKAVFFDRNSKRELSPKDAYYNGLVSLRGTLLIAGLFDVHPSLIAPVKKVEKKKRVSRPGHENADLAVDQVKVTLEQAMKQGLIDSRAQRFRQGNIDLTLDEALNQGLIDPSSEWIVPSKSAGVGPTIEEKTTESITETGQQLAPKYFPDKNVEESVTTVKRVRTTETTALGGPGGVSTYRAITGGRGTLEVPATGYHIYEAERKGIVDLTTGNISAPNVDRTITFAEGIELGILESSTIKVKDNSGRLVGVKEALESKIMDKNGAVRGYNVEQAIEEKLIVIDAEPLVPYSNTSKNIIQIPAGSGQVISFRPVGQPIVEESEQSWSFDSSRGLLVDHLSGEQLTLDQALAHGKLAPEDLCVRDALTGREMSFIDAEKWGVIDRKNGYYLDKTTNKRMHFAEAAQQHRIYPTGGVPDHAGDAVHTTVKVQTRTQVAKKEALSSGAPLTENTLGKALALGWYEAQSGTFVHPDTHKTMTLKEAIIKGLFNPYDSTVLDRKNNKEISLLEAIQEGIVDDTAGTVVDTSNGRSYDLKSALAAGIIKGKMGDTLDSGLISGRLDLSSGHYEHNGTHLPLHEALNKNIVDHSSVIVRDPASGHEYSYHEAITRNIVDPERGLIRNVETNESTSFPSALTSGLLASSSSVARPSQGQHRIVEQKLQLTPFAPQQVRGEGRHELVDLGGGRQVPFKVVRTEGGMEKGEYVDPSTGMKFTIQMQGDPFVTETKTQVKSTSQVQSVELEPYAEFVGIDRVRDKRDGRIMSLEDAKRINLARVDKKGKQMTKSYSVFRSNIQNAVNNGVMDSHMEKMSLEDAIHAGVVDIRNQTYRNPKTGDSISLTQAANMGLVDVTLSETLAKGVCNPGNNERITIQKAIDLGIIDARTGKVRDPLTRKDLTWLDIVKPVWQAITAEGVFDPAKGQRIPVTSAINEGLINTRTKTYHNPINGENVELSMAVERGLIDRGTYEVITKPFLEDYRTHRQVNLLEAVDSKLVDPKHRTIQLSRQSIVPIAKAIHDGRIPSDIGDKLRRVDKFNFAEALGKGIIDVRANIFTDPDTGRQMTITQAIQEGHIDTGNVESMEGSDVKNLTYVINSDEFDENSGRIRDRKTGLYLTFKDAVDRDVIDGDSLLHDVDGSQTLTLREALSRNRIDSDGKYNAGHTKMKLKDAVKCGLIALIESPMQAAQAVTEAVKRRDAEGYKFKIEPVEGAGNRGSRTSMPKFREETTVITRLTPQKQDPGLSVRMRQSTTSIGGDRARSFIDDPAALADFHHDFLSRLEANRFDTDEKIIENPMDHRRISVREAAETGLLDVSTGEIVHPETGRRFSIPQAMNMKMVMVGDDAAQRLMKELNVSLEERNQMQQEMSPSGAIRTSSTFSPAGESGSRTFTKTVNWSGQPAELRKSRTDPLAEYTSYTSSTTESTRDAPIWARRD